MIITKLTGGIGNQMFQYAVGRTLSYKYKTDLLLDISFYNTQSSDIKRIFSLDSFNIKARIASQNENRRLCKWQYFSFIPKRIYRNILPKHFTNYLKEKDVTCYINKKSQYYDKRVLKIGDNVVLQGYWGNENYFISIEQTIRKEFTLKDELISPAFLEIENEILSKNSVSIHFRRTDYLNKQNGIYELFGICEKEYYDAAITYILSRIVSPYFFIFTDDVEWVKNNFRLSFPNYLVSYNNFKDYEELMLMSYCKHNIIANSTFSWWGAWLNNFTEKQIIAPKKWFRNPFYQNFYEKSDFVPHTWTRL